MITKPLANPNIFQTERDLSTSDSGTTAVSIRCPHCNQLGTFNKIGQMITYLKKHANENAVSSFIAAMRICPNSSCRGIILVIQQNGLVIEVKPPQLLDFTLENLPPLCQSTLKEAIACHAAGAYKAAAIMVRRLLEEICELNGALGNNLHERLNVLKTKIILPSALFDAMNELKILGNDAAHIEAKAYEEIGKDEAEISIELVKEILKGIYQLQDLVNRLQSRKKP